MFADTISAFILPMHRLYIGTVLCYWIVPRVHVNACFLLLYINLFLQRLLISIMNWLNRLFSRQDRGSVSFESLIFEPGRAVKTKPLAL